MNKNTSWLTESERPLSKSLPDIIGDAKTVHVMKDARAMIEKRIGVEV